MSETLKMLVVAEQTAKAEWLAQKPGSAAAYRALGVYEPIRNALAMARWEASK